jgi:hypothetical protein
MRQEERDRIAAWLAAFSLLSLFIGITYALVVGC